jgi:hypothetical protein
MRSLNAFIAHLRKNYVNKPFIVTSDKETGLAVKLAISEKGLIYDMYFNVENYDSQRSYEIYSSLYAYAAENTEYKEMLANKEEFKE